MNPLRVIWLQSGGCGGCSMSLLNAESPDVYTHFKQCGIDLLWHPSLSENDGTRLTGLLQDIIDDKQPLDVLCLEGAVMQGPNGTGRYHLMGGDKPMMQWIKDLSGKAKYTVAMGSCAAYGGITTAGGNPGEATGLQYNGSQPGGLLPPEWRSQEGLPVINIAGCPPHPNWVTDTLGQLAFDEINNQSLDSFHRPRSYTDHLVHHGCPRNEFYEYKASAELPSHQGCMMEHMGCLGTQARADCNIRPWNGNGSCLFGGYACINCTSPDFEEPHETFCETPKVAGIPVGLPTDMPKAWFVALASLSKAATPQRLRNNATSDYIVTPPGKKEGNK